MKTSKHYLYRVIAPSLALATSLSAATEDVKLTPKEARNKAAIQTMYREGVPQIDKQGRPLKEYDPAKSFFPIGLWGSPLPTEENLYFWDKLKELHYNTVWPHTSPAIPSLDAGAKYGMQIVQMEPQSDETLKAIANNPNLLANVWRDEPTLDFVVDPKFDMEKYFKEFLTYQENAAKIAPGLPVFINNTADIINSASPGIDWWTRWNKASTISCLDNYPIVAGGGDRIGLPTSIGQEPTGLPQTLAFALSSNTSGKPLWLIVGAFRLIPDPALQPSFRYPTPTQLRAQVYTALIHGATGIHYFILDSPVSRAGNVLGMSPDPKPVYPPDNKTPATPMDMVNARALWETAATINSELVQIVPSILSPTVGPEVDYAVDIKGQSQTKSPIRCLLKPYGDGSYLLMTVNLDNSVLQVKYTFPKNLVEVERLFENQGVQKFEKPQKDFSIQYDPFDTHVFRIKPITAK